MRVADHAHSIMLELAFAFSGILVMAADLGPSATRWRGCCPSLWVSAGLDHRLGVPLTDTAAAAKGAKRASPPLGSSQIMITGRIVRPKKDAIKDNDSIELWGTLTWADRNPPKAVELTLWAGGRPNTVPVADESDGRIVKILSTSRDKRSGQAEWRGTIRAHGVGAEVYYIQAVPVDKMSTQYKDSNNKIVDWTAPLTIHPRGRRE